MKTNEDKHRNEPARFFGDGVVFKAKLIGILEVGEARGDRMCQEALQDLKIAIRAAGEHKQRITIHVTIEGLRLRDEKTGESLYHHPVHKISFIAQDMTDSRAFGYIFGSPDCGHRFFGIKTDKAASQVVLAMRDLFQCVFELKKKEIELAKQHIQNRITAHEHQQVKNTILEHKKTSSLSNEASVAKVTSKAEKSPEATANLVDLEQELSSIQRGITQMERITPNDDVPTKNVLDDDPFGDSFASFSSTPFSILPPPASSKRNQQKQSDDTMSELASIIGTTASSTPPIPPFPNQQTQSNESWLNSRVTASIFDEPETKDDVSTKPDRSSFDDNPLGTGKSKPYIDKKYFFQDLKNPPKKVLKDLTEKESVFDAHFSPQKRTVPSIKGSSLDSSITSTSNIFDSITKPSIDPFEEEDFSKINIDPFDTSKISPKAIILPDTKISSTAAVETVKQPLEERKSSEMSNNYSSPLQVDLPPESWSSFSEPKRLDRQGSDGSSRNVFSVDSFSKKLPKANLFGQRNVKRESNGINMRRLQESDSLSENEPELPPRHPESGSHEPPPLPPKNHRDIYIYSDESKNRYGRTGVAAKESTNRYEYTGRFKSQSSDSPPLPLPSRKVNRNDSSSTNRPFKKFTDEEDYLTPNPSQQSTDIPTILPPPPQQRKDPSKIRNARRSETDPKNLDAPTPPVSARPCYSSDNITPILPDITLSQLLTLGIEDLAQKLNVPSSKLNTMTLVELTTYLSEFIEKTKHKSDDAVESPPNDSPVFKVSFDESADATFVAKFDDNFGESDDNTFVANFENFNQPPVSVIPTADRYAVFREIIEQEMQQHQLETQHQESIESNNSNSLEDGGESSNEFQKEFDNRFSPRTTPFENTFQPSPNTVHMSKIDTKITDAISGAKDRYAALRDIILVEDLFDKKPLPPLASISDSNLSDELADDHEQIFETAEVADNNSIDNIPTCSISWADAEDQEGIPLENYDQPEEQKSEQALHNDKKVLSTSNIDDFEIDDYMKRAISEISLENRPSSCNQMKSPSLFTKAGENTLKQPSPSPTQLKTTTLLNDMSTSPIPIPPKSPAENVIQNEEPTQPENYNESQEEAVKENVVKSQDEAKESTVELVEISREKTITPSKELKQEESAESWAVFEQQNMMKPRKESSMTPTNIKTKQGQDSPYSSDGKNEWKQREEEYHRRWPKKHTSSSSRDVSPWDEDGPIAGDHRRRPNHPPSHHHSTDRYARPPAPRRRINSCDEDYDDYERRPMPPRNRPTKGPIHRSREILDSENPNWYHSSEHWSPVDDDEEGNRIERGRPFDRNTYERSTFGPPYDKREPKSLPYDRRDYKSYDKRSKYYRSPRNDYEYDQYEVPPPSRGKSRKDFDDYDIQFERGTRECRSAREYFYDRDRKSFDSNESYDSGRHRVGSGEIYGSYEGRSDFRERDRHMTPSNRPIRRNQRSRGAPDSDDDDDVRPRRPSGETGSLQRQTGPRSKQIQLDDEVWGISGGKNWKRPSSATAADRMSGSGGLSGSDEDSDKRYRRKNRIPKNKEIELRSNYATIRYSQQQQQPRNKEYYDYEDDGNDYPEEPLPNSVSPRLQEQEYYARRKPSGNVRTNTTPRSETKGFSEYVKPPPRYGGYEEPENDFESRRIQPQTRGGFKKSSSRDLYVDEQKEHYQNVKLNRPTFDDEEPRPMRQLRRPDYPPTEAVEQQVVTKPPSSAAAAAAVTANNNKFNFDGFESDFNSTSPKQNEAQKSDQTQKFSFETEFSSSPAGKNGASQQKLRFNENVSVSKFDSNAASSQFEDDFLEQWTPTDSAATPSSVVQSSSMKKMQGNLKSNSSFSRQENLKKSDSVNIFARKSDEDPFENDEFFNEGQQESGGEQDPFKWKNNFANFDDNKNI